MEKKIDAREAEFQSKNQWYSFTQAVYGALGWASFIGLLGTIANSVVNLAVGEAAQPGAVEFAKALFTQTTPLVAIGGLMAFGVACTYMAQREATKLKSLQDTHLAEESAKCMSVGKSVCVDIEHEQNQRADGKKWAAVIAANENQLAHGAVR